MAKAIMITLSSRINAILEAITRKAKCPQNLVKRIKIILMAANGMNNSEISRELKIDRGVVKEWRNRWVLKTSKLEEAEKSNLEDKDIQKIISEILSDKYRSGCPTTFSSEQIVQIVNIALEKPEDSVLPITHWSETALAQEAIKRNIVESISQRSVGRFLKKSRRKTAQKSILAEL
jgi:putative transposase